MAVNPEFRGKRYGEILMKHDFEALKRMGATRIEMATRTNNEPALKLYRRMGMVEFSVVDGFYYLGKDL